MNNKIAINTIALASIALLQAACGGLTADPAPTADLKTIQVDAFQFNHESDDLDGSASNMEIFLRDTVTGNYLYCSGRRTGMDPVHAQNIEHTDLAGTFVPVDSDEEHPEEIGLVTIEAWDKDIASCPALPNTDGHAEDDLNNFIYEDVDDLHGSTTITGVDATTAGTITLDGGAGHFDISIRELPETTTATYAELAALALDGFVRNVDDTGEADPEIEIAIISNETSESIACVGTAQGTVDLDDSGFQYTGLNIPFEMRIAENDTLPVDVRVAMIERDSGLGCPAVIETDDPDSGLFSDSADDLLGLSDPMLLSDFLDATEVILTRDAGTVSFGAYDPDAPQHVPGKSNVTEDDPTTIGCTLIMKQ